MHFPTRAHDPNDHVLVVLGHHGHPTFKTINTDEKYLNLLGEKMVQSKGSRYIRHKVVSSHNVFTFPCPD